MADDGADDAGAGGAGATGGAGAERPRAEMGDAPPFLTWRGIYLIVLGALVVEAALGVVLTVRLR